MALYRRILLSLCLASGLASLVAAFSLPASAAALKLEDYAVGSYPIGGDFTLINHDGGRTSLSQFRGKAVLLSFGYTHCPDVCPTTLSNFKLTKQALGPQGSKLQALFISVDPKRDTPAFLKQYVGHFDPTFIGLTGSEDELQALAERYFAKFRIRDAEGQSGYFVDHTTFTYLIDTKGKVRYLFPRDVERDLVVAGVQAVLAAGS